MSDQTNRPSNVIVICCDTFRYDHLGFLKKHEVYTPNLDQLAQESAAFTDFWLCSFSTLLTRAEAFTGRYRFPFYPAGAVPREFPVLAEVFKHHGYDTALFTDNWYMMTQKRSFSRGFDFVKNVRGQAQDHFQNRKGPMIDLPCPREKLEPRDRSLDRYRRNAHWYRQRNSSTLATLFESAMEWFKAPRDKFFVWFDVFDPHEPWEAPEQFLKQYPWNPAGDAVTWPKKGYAKAYNDADLQNMRSLYKAEISHVDHWIGRLLAQLRQTGQMDSTAVIFFSDHGYYFGERGFLGKPGLKLTKRPLTIYQELGRLPLLVRHPHGIAAGKTIAGLCQTPDLYTTALELAGIPSVPWAQGSPLVARMRGASKPQKFIVCGCHSNKGSLGCLNVQTEEWCLIYSPVEGLTGSELYHMPTDPAQARNVITENRNVAEELFAMLNKWFDDLGVPAGWKQQFLTATNLTRWNRLHFEFRRMKNQLAFRKKFRAYAE